MTTAIAGISIAALSALFGIWSKNDLNIRKAAIASVLTILGLFVGIVAARQSYSDSMERAETAEEKQKLIAEQFSEQKVQFNEKFAEQKKQFDENFIEQKVRFDSQRMILERAIENSKKELDLISSTLQETKTELANKNAQLTQLYERINSPLNNDFKFSFALVLPNEIIGGPYKRKEYLKDQEKEYYNEELRQIDYLEEDQYQISLEFRFFFSDGGHRHGDFQLDYKIDNKKSDPPLIKYKKADKKGIVVNNIEFSSDSITKRVNRNISTVDFNGARVEVAIVSSFSESDIGFAGLLISNEKGQQQALLFSNRYSTQRDDYGYAIFEEKFAQDLKWNSWDHLPLMIDACPQPLPVGINVSAVVDRFGYSEKCE